MDVGMRSAGKTLKKIGDQFGFEVTHVAYIDFRFHDRCRASAEIDGDEPEGLIHRHDEISGTENSALRAQGFRESFPQCNSDIFNRVVLVYVQVTGRMQPQVEGAVAGKQLEHVVEETDAGRDVVASAALDGEGKIDRGLAGLAFDDGLS